MGIANGQAPYFFKQEEIDTLAEMLKNHDPVPMRAFLHRDAVECEHCLDIEHSELIIIADVEGDFPTRRQFFNDVMYDAYDKGIGFEIEVFTPSEFEEHFVENYGSSDNTMVVL